MKNVFYAFIIVGLLTACNSQTTTTETTAPEAPATETAPTPPAETPPPADTMMTVDTAAAPQ